MYANRGLNIFSPFSNNLDRLFGSLDTPSYYGVRADNLAPACDIEESENHFLISLEMPGFKKEDVRIDVNGSLLTISGERRRESESAGESERRYSERRFGKFQRSFTLPEGVDVDKIEAQYEDGILNLAIPKAESAKPRQIKIGTGGASRFLSKLLTSPKEVPKNRNHKIDRSVSETSDDYERREAAS